MKKNVFTLLTFTAGLIIGGFVSSYKNMNKVKQQTEMSNKLLTLFLMMDQWVNVKQEGKDLSEYFEKKGYTEIAIYGMSYAGIALYRELNNTKTTVKYGIDRNAGNLAAPVDVYTIENQLGKVDAVVVTAVSYFDQIEKELRQKFNCPILSLDDILYEV